MTGTDEHSDESTPPVKVSGIPGISRLGAWGRLLRVPNLLTVGGDPLAGYCLATGLAAAQGDPPAGPSPIAAIFASLLFYAGGLIHNDLSDLAEDRRDRPARPLPAGHISTPVAQAVMLLCFAGAIATLKLAYQHYTPLAIGAALLLAILLYNRVTKSLATTGQPSKNNGCRGGSEATATMLEKSGRHGWMLQAMRFLGPVNMGLCRGLSLLLGCAVVPGFLPDSLLIPLAAAGGATLYIAAVTAAAAGEVRTGVSPILRWLPVMAATAWGVATTIAIGFLSQSTDLLPFAAIFAGGVISSAWPAIRLTRHAPPSRIQKAIGWWIRNLLIFQAAFCTLLPGSGGPILAAVLLTLWPTAAILSRRFYAS
ncbi:MAG: UbiA family prenyltransferase [Phycisphaerae bacterium]|nr:UbiA family prenyltransferase [Phycisphaerae bacterium]